MKIYYVATGDEFEYILFESPYLSEMAKYLGKNLNTTRCLFSTAYKKRREKSKRRYKKQYKYGFYEEET